MSVHPEEKPFIGITMGPEGSHFRLRHWSATEWDGLRPEHRPRQAVRFGLGWVELVPDVQLIAQVAGGR